MAIKTLDRRRFLARSSKTTLGFATGLTVLANSKSARGTPANEQISLAMIGVGGRGNALASGFLDRDDCRLSYVCDVNSNVGQARAKKYAARQAGQPPKFVQDFREMLSDPSVGAVVIATPDHWHAPAAILACQAGKDVYVEKPPSITPREGQQIIQAARTHERIVQVGTQNRSAPYNLSAKKYIEEGKLGHVHLCRVFNMKEQKNFKLGADEAPPAGLDWNMWNGPSPERAYNRTIHYQGWHHFWDYSGGDIANDGVHQLDLARWLVGVELPKAVHSTGGRFAGEGDAETPDTQIATYQFDDLIMTFELALFTPYMLKTDPGVRESDRLPYWQQNATRIEIYGTKGVMFVGRHGGGWEVFARPHDRKPVVAKREFGRFPDAAHKENFVQSLHSRKLPNADIEQGHRSALLVHYANISHRLGGEQLKIDADENFVGSPAADDLFQRKNRHPWFIQAAT